jgi:hypothetical protein
MNAINHEALAMDTISDDQNLLAVRIGQAIARDVKAEGMPANWTGLDAQDGDQLTAAGVMPDTPQWGQAIAVAKQAFRAAMAH